MRAFVRNARPAAVNLRHRDQAIIAPECQTRTMRVFFSLVAVIVLLALVAFGQRRDNPQLAQVLFAFAALFAVLLVAAFFGLY